MRAQAAGPRHPSAAPASAAATSDTAAAAPLTLAQLRADPGHARGRTVAWDVQIFALETADALRQGLIEGELYLLVTGPGEQNAILYVAVPPTLEQTARLLASIAPVRVHLVATVRVARSDPLGVPILDAAQLTRRQ
jgi:hypothetical protein